MKRLALTALGLIAGSTWALDQQRLEDACHERIKPLVPEQAKVTKVLSYPPGSHGVPKGFRGWYVQFYFDSKLLDGMPLAQCQFDPKGRIISDTYSDHRSSQEREKAVSDREAAAKRKAARYN